MLYFLFVAILIKLSDSLIKELSNCHDDSTLKPADGMLKENTFNWVAFIRYIHVTTGLDHHSKAPRIVLIHRQFGLGTAQDMLRLPKNYKLGNVVFGEYDRDEVQCNMTKSQLKLGLTCPRAYLEMPYIDILPHPEFTRFGVGNSLAIIKFIRPLKSGYMLPICLPSLGERERLRKIKIVFMIDYMSTVPRDFNIERLAKKTLKMYTHRECRKHRMRSRLGSEGVTHVLCSSGCGIRPGAPVVSHARDGAFEVIGLSAAGGECTRRGQRHRLNSRPPIFIDVYPYNQWIINVITANLMPQPYPNNFQLTDSGGMSLQRGRVKKFATPWHDEEMQKYTQGWRGRAYVVGRTCYNRPASIKRMNLFYHEIFEVVANPPAKMNVYLKVFADLECKIKCVKMKLPNQTIIPRILGLERHNISVELHTDWFPLAFYFTLSIYARNASEGEIYVWASERGG